MTRARLVLSLAGLGFAIAGVITDDRRLIWVAIVAVSLSVLFRVLARRRPSR